MSTGLDLSQFFETFFDEAGELLADIEQLLLGVDVEQPDIDQLNAIFRAAHSIKGGAATFGCFGQLAETTHLLENILDAIRRGEMPLRQDMIDIFLETKDVLMDQVVAYRASQQPDAEAYERICRQLRQLAQQNEEPAAATPEQAGEQAATAEPPEQGPTQTLPLHIRLLDVNEKDAAALRDEMALMGDVLHTLTHADGLSIWLSTTASASDIEAVCCFIIDEKQLSIVPEPVPGSQSSQAVAQQVAETAAVANPTTLDGATSAAAQQAQADKLTEQSRKAQPAKDGSSTIRVGVEKVDQIINLVGELVITQAMLMQVASTLDPVLHDRLLNGIDQLDRNARDLQEAVMSIRMMPMDYVFSRFPRVVRENASKMGKRIRLLTQGQATELDKSLIERIIDPLTHLVRNSLDHGFELPDDRIAAGKSPEGTLTLSAQHSGGQIVIEVSDDGAGLSRERILNKAMAQGFAVNDSTPDDELWQLIFAPGFSTAAVVSDISGRGVGMDVVRRNIQAMGGHVYLSSRAGQGTTTRIVLPLTLAILDGMSVQVGKETFILPLGHVTESLQPVPEQVHNISANEKVLHVRGEYLPIVALHQVFDVPDAERDISQSIAVILKADETRFALLVDHLIGQHQVVVKNLEANYRKIPGVSAATILGDGSVALIVDVFALMRLTREGVAA